MYTIHSIHALCIHTYTYAHVVIARDGRSLEEITVEIRSESHDRLEDKPEYNKVYKTEEEQTVDVWYF